jgi:hypothetical protein
MNGHAPLTRLLIAAVGIAALASCGKSHDDMTGDPGQPDADVTTTPDSPDAATADTASPTGGTGGGIDAGIDSMGGTGGAIADAGTEVDGPAAAPIEECPPDPEPAPGAEPTCPGNVAELDGWLPVTPAVHGCRPPSHPDTECRFYQFSWQNFLLATQPDADGKPAFLGWGTVENTFGAHAGEPSPEVPVLSGGVTQAGGRQVLVDQNGHVVYYGMHMNRQFVDFVNEHHLITADAVRHADPNLAFPADVVELKSAWQIVDDGAAPADFITARVQVPTLRMKDGQMAQDMTNMREVTVALLALHVVFTLPGHPEFIWSTFQHVDADGLPDVAPNAPANPQATSPSAVISSKGGLLYHSGTTAANGNLGLASLMFDETTQSFPTQRTSVYRVFPGSKSNTTDLDDDVTAINELMRDRFSKAQLPATDRRGHYLLVGAIWQDKPEKSFGVNKLLVNDDTLPDIKKNGGDSPLSITGGEDRLSSTAMESFTQATDSFPNCFSCHDTRATTGRGVPAARDQSAPVTMEAKMINVSHIFSEVSRLNP